MKRAKSVIISMSVAVALIIGNAVIAGEVKYKKQEILKGVETPPERVIPQSSLVNKEKTVHEIVNRVQNLEKRREEVFGRTQNAIKKVMSNFENSQDQSEAYSSSLDLIEVAVLEYNKIIAESEQLSELLEEEKESLAGLEMNSEGHVKAVFKEREELVKVIDCATQKIIDYQKMEDFGDRMVNEPKFRDKFNWEVLQAELAENNLGTVNMEIASFEANEKKLSTLSWVLDNSCVDVNEFTNEIKGEISRCENWNKMVELAIQADVLTGAGNIYRGLSESTRVLSSDSVNASNGLDEVINSRVKSEAYDIEDIKESSRARAEKIQKRGQDFVKRNSVSTGEQ